MLFPHLCWQFDDFAAFLVDWLLFDCFYLYPRFCWSLSSVPVSRCPCLSHPSSSAANNFVVLQRKTCRLTYRKWWFSSQVTLKIRDGRSRNVIQPLEVYDLCKKHQTTGVEHVPIASSTNPEISKLT